MNESEKMLYELLSKKIEKLEEKVDNLNAWKFKLIGASTVCTFLASLASKLL